MDAVLYNLKLFMKITSTITSICLIISLLAIAGKAFHIDGMAVLLILSLTLASSIFFLEIPLSILYFKGTGNVIAISVLVCFGLSILLVGILFRIMFWPGSMPMVIAGLPFLVIALILAGMNQATIRSMDDSKRKVLIWGVILPAVVFLVVGLSGWLIPSDVFWSIFSSQSVR